MKPQHRSCSWHQVCLKQKQTWPNYASRDFLLFSNTHSIHIYQFTMPNSYWFITSGKILYSMTLQYCVIPDRLKHKTKFSFCDGILCQDQNQFPLAKNCMVLSQTIHTQLKIHSGLGYCLSNSFMIASVFSPFYGSIRPERRKTSTILEYKTNGKLWTCSKLFSHA